MSQYIKQNTDGSAGMVGTSGGDGEFVNIEFRYDAASVDRVAMVASRPYIVKSVYVRPDVVGSDGSAVTVTVKIAPSGTAIASGTAVHASTGNLKGTAHTNQALTLSTTPSELILPAGSALGVDFGGTMTAAVGVVSIGLCPA